MTRLKRRGRRGASGHHRFRPVGGGGGGQEAIRTLAAEYFTLMGTILAAPEASHESVCCSEEVLQELTLYGWMASTNLYPRISIQVTLSRPETYPDGTVR